MDTSDVICCWGHFTGKPKDMSMACGVLGTPRQHGSKLSPHALAVWQTKRFLAHVVSPNQKNDAYSITKQDKSFFKESKHAQRPCLHVSIGPPSRFSRAPNLWGCKQSPGLLRILPSQELVNICNAWHGRLKKTKMPNQRSEP